MSLDFTRERCRICLDTTESHLSLHKTVPIAEDDVLMSKILIYCGNIEVSHDDRKPQNACFACIENAKMAYKFRMMCTQSETTLNTEIFNKTIDQRDPLEFKKEEDIIEVSDVEIRYIEEEQPNLNNSDDYSEESNDNDNEENTDCFEYNNEQEESNDGDVENAGKTNKNRFNCSDCGKSYMYRCQMLRHYITHKKIKCHYCDFIAAGREMVKHMSKMHDDIKNHVCRVCGKDFKWEALLKAHMLRHSGERPYSCTLCDKKFYSKSDQKVHMNIHTRQRVFKCDVCSKEFYRKYHLKVHLKSHTRERQYVCEVCEKKYIRAESLQKHKKMHHPD